MWKQGFFRKTKILNEWMWSKWGSLRVWRLCHSFRRLRLWMKLQFIWFVFWTNREHAVRLGAPTLNRTHYSPNCLEAPKKWILFFNSCVFPPRRFWLKTISEKFLHFYVVRKASRFQSDIVTASSPFRASEWWWIISSMQLSTKRFNHCDGRKMDVFLWNSCSGLLMPSQSNQSFSFDIFELDLKGIVILCVGDNDFARVKLLTSLIGLIRTVCKFIFFFWP